MESYKKYFSNEKELSKMLEGMTNARIICKCGHSVLMEDKTKMAICNWCGHLVFKDKKTEFEYRMKEKLIKEKRNLR